MSRFKKVTAVMLCLTFIFTMFASSASAAATSYYLSYQSRTTEQQETNFWCWAASAVNASLLSRNTATRVNSLTKQESAVQAAFGYVDRTSGGTVTDVKNAANYASGGNQTYRVVEDRLLYWYEIVSNLSLNKPIIPGGGHYEGSYRYQGHVFLIYGAISDANAGTERLSIIDPMGDSDANRRVTCTFTQFKQGCAATGYYIYDCTVVCQ